jgi:hypothetical protein
MDMIHILIIFSMSYQKADWQSSTLDEKCDVFNFAIFNYPFLYSDIPLSPSWNVVYIAQFIIYTTSYFVYENFSNQGQLQTRRFMLQSYKCNESKLKFSFRKFYYGLVSHYKSLLAYKLTAGFSPFDDG